MTAPKIFCLDIGNTHVDYGLVTDRRVEWRGRIPTRQIPRPDHQLALFLCQLPDHAPAGIAYCSVVPAATAPLQALLDPVAKAHGYPVLMLTNDCCPGLPIAYPRRTEIGGDLLAMAIAAQAFYGLPAFALSLGTAIAGAIISERGFEGGVIAPGYGMINDALHEKTALLPRLTLDQQSRLPGTLGRSTEDAMMIGCRIGFIGMVKNIVAHVAQGMIDEGFGKPKLIVTGGTMALLPDDWHPALIHEPNLSLLGLAEAYRRRYL